MCCDPLLDFVGLRRIVICQICYRWKWVYAWDSRHYCSLVCYRHPSLFSVDHNSIVVVEEYNRYWRYVNAINAGHPHPHYFLFVKGGA
jgi:hypothetical protein